MICPKCLRTGSIGPETNVGGETSHDEFSLKPRENTIFHFSCAWAVKCKCFSGELSLQKKNFQTANASAI